MKNANQVIKQIEEVDSTIFESWQGKVCTREQMHTLDSGERKSQKQFFTSIPIEIARFIKLRRGDSIQIAIRKLPLSPRFARRKLPPSQSQPHVGLTPPRRGPSALNIGRNRGENRERPRLGNRKSTHQRQTA